MSGELAYFWIPVPDAERAKAFYGALVGWKFAPGNAPEGYQITNSPKHPVLWGSCPRNPGRVPVSPRAARASAKRPQPATGRTSRTSLIIAVEAKLSRLR